MDHVQRALPGRGSARRGEGGAARSARAARRRFCAVDVRRGALLDAEAGLVFWRGLRVGRISEASLRIQRARLLEAAHRLNDRDT